MKRTLLLLLFSYAAWGQVDTVTSIKDDDKKHTIKKEWTTAANDKYKIEYRYHKDGSKDETTYLNGTEIFYQTWTNTGMKEREIYYDINDDYNGQIIKLYYPSGKLKSEDLTTGSTEMKAKTFNGDSVNVKVGNGFYRGYYENGNLKYESFIKDGKGEGFYNEYDERGIVTKKIFRIKGKEYIIK
jgi:antitoxin component YwqK of YwqJK toxin-antitoxin module